MRLRAFALLLTLAFGLLAAPVLAEAQRMRARIAILGPPEEPRFSEVRDGLMLGLRDEGYSEQHIEMLEARVSRGDRAGARAAVEAAVRQRVQVLFVIGSKLARLARKVSSELAIVYITPGDPVKHGLASSLAHPGGNTTAMTFEYPELAGKRLQVLKEMLPEVRRILILYDPRDTSPRQGAEAVRQAASKLGLTLVEREIRSREDMARGLDALEAADAFLVVPGGLPTGHYAEIIRASNAKRIPTMFHARTGSTMDALLSYGASDAEVARQMARQVAKILEGAKAGDLPVERPTKLELVINLKTANALGLTIPDSVLFQADKVIK